MSEEVSSAEVEIHSVPEEQLRRIGTQLQNENCGDCIFVELGQGRCSPVLMFTSIPSKCEYAFVHEGCVFALSRKDICTVLQMYERYYTQRTIAWTAKTHGDGRITASCSAGGIPRPSKSAGIRNRVSWKQDCPARVKFRDLMHYSCGTGGSRDVLARIRQEVRRTVLNHFTSLNPSALPPTSLVFVTEMQFNHTCQASALSARGNLSSREINSSVEAVNTRDIREALEDFLSIPGRQTRGNVAAATQFLEKKLPGITAGESVIRNTITSITQNDADAEDLVKFLQSQTDSPSGSVECLRVGTNNGSLDYCVWSPTRSKSTVDKYGAEVGTVDATHKVTKYDLKLFTWIVPDCTSRSRPVMFALVQDESIGNFQAVRADYMRAFTLKLPSVIFSDNCSAFSSALSVVPGTTIHLLCIWHVLDNKSIKPRVGPCIVGAWRTGASLGLSFCVCEMLHIAQTLNVCGRRC